MGRNRKLELAESAIRNKAEDLARDVQRLEISQKAFNQAITMGREAGISDQKIVRLMEQGTPAKSQREALTRYIGQATPTQGGSR